MVAYQQTHQSKHVSATAKGNRVKPRRKRGKDKGQGKPTSEARATKATPPEGGTYDAPLLFCEQQHESTQCARTASKSAWG